MLTANKKSRIGSKVILTATLILTLPNKKSVNAWKAIEQEFSDERKVNLTTIVILTFPNEKSVNDWKVILRVTHISILTF